MLVGLPAILSAQTQPAFIEHPLPELSTPSSIVTGADGALWFTNGTTTIGRMTTAGELSQFNVPNAPGELLGITAGPDGALWFAESHLHAGRIGRITTSGSVTEYPLPLAGSDPTYITTGPDGALWFTERISNRVGRITTTGAITEYSVPTPSSRPMGITAGPDGALWFTEYEADQIGRITTAGVITEYPISGGFGNPNFIVTGPDGALWFTEAPFSNGGIGRMTTSGLSTVYPIPGLNLGNPYGITVGPDGALWFAEYYGDNISRITTDGTTSQYPIPSIGSYPFGIATGPDGDLWFTESYPSDGNRIGQLVFPTAALSPTPSTGIPGASLTLTGSGFSSNENVNIYANSTGVNLRTVVTADGAGSFLLAGRIHQAPEGGTSLVGVGQTSGKMGVASIVISARLDLTPTSGVPGDIITAQGFGFAIGEQVKVYWNAPKILLGTMTVNGLGTFTGFTFAIPPGVSPGPHAVYGQGVYVTGIATITVE
jgi:streptogramin lyase